MRAASGYSVVLADDHPAFRAGVKQYFDGRQDFIDIFETGDGNACLSSILQHQPDWAVIDLSMPGKTGFEVLEELLTKNCSTRVIVMSMHAEQIYADRARNLGAVAFIAKEDALSDLDDALQTPEGDFYTSNAVGRAAANFLTEKSTNLLSSLTPTEKRVLQFLAQGLTSKEIADHLSISARTVQAHRRNMTEKLNLRGANRLMEFAVRNAEKI